MRVIRVRIRTREEFLEAFSEDVPTGALFCPTTVELEVDQRVVVELSYPDLPNKMMLAGSVRSWRGAIPRLRVRAGAFIVFEQAERLKLNFVLDVISGQRKGGVRRKHARIPVELPVNWRLASTSLEHKGYLREISVGGAQLVTKQDLQLDAELVIEFTAPGGSRPIAISSKVAYETPTGYGLRFVYRDGGGSRRLKEMVRRLVEQS
jgi:Tfp pilus assembly protein PilZ